MTDKQKMFEDLLLYGFCAHDDKGNYVKAERIIELTNKQTIMTFEDLKQIGFVVFPDGNGTTRYHFDVPDGVQTFDSMLIAEWDDISGQFNFLLQNYSYGADAAYDLPFTNIKTIEDIKELIETIEKFI